MRVLVNADVRPVPEGTGLRSLGAAVFESKGHELHVTRVGAEVAAHAIEASGALVVLAYGAACTWQGQLHSSGLMSSELALESLEQAVRTRGWPVEGAEPQWLRDVVTSASARACEFATASLTSRLALVLLHGEGVWVAHVGDVSVSKLHAATFTELTEDHTLRRQWRESGSNDELAAAEKRGVPLDALLTRVFGSELSSLPEVQQVAVERGDLLVLAHRSLVDSVRESGGAFQQVLDEARSPAIVSIKWS